jgi:hypothetical protein
MAVTHEFGAAKRLLLKAKTRLRESYQIRCLGRLHNICGPELTSLPNRSPRLKPKAKMPSPTEFEAFQRLLAQSKHIIAVAGAGLSAASGIPRSAMSAAVTVSHRFIMYRHPNV